MRKNALLLPLLIVIFFLTSCCPTRYPTDLHLDGADEFVMDSFLIRQGKSSILEFKGEETFDIDLACIEEFQDGIDEGDLLNIVLFHPSRRDLMESVSFVNQNIGFKVIDGFVSLPDLPPIYIRGLTLEQARCRLKRELESHVGEFDLFVSYKERLSKKVELAGGVRLPEVILDGKMRLFDVLSKAQVSNEANFFKSYISREGIKLPVDLYKLMNEGDMSQNIVMKGGDKIFIAKPEDSLVLVLGEVMNPTTVPLPYGFISLREALTLAGGIPYTGNRSCIQVIRGGIPEPKIYILSWEHIINLPNDSLLLIPGDTVYVAETPLTKWNRFITQILPTVAGFESSHKAYGVIIAQ